ncbi:hypothetical protein [Streptomyces sp. PU-14G]|uniref:hypothetical protein n=1 Tax=Streptomyces sp. PU-14G TaxID=2800808 RepID=UPI0034DDEF9C
MAWRVRPARSSGPTDSPAGRWSAATGAEQAAPAAAAWVPRIEFLRRLERPEGRDVLGPAPSG